jgi:sugar lactone lactonase YvrE
MKKTISILLLSFLIFSCADEKKIEVKKELNKQAKKADSKTFPKTIILNNIAQNPEGIAFDKNDNTFLLSSLNALPIVKVNLDGTFKPFTSGEKFPLSTAGLEVDYKRNRLLVAGFNGMELMDNNPKTKGVAILRIYNLKTGILEKDINLSSLIPDASAYFANDIAVDDTGNIYISDWYARVIYKVDLAGNASVFWKNETGVPSGPNGLDFHSDGYLLVSILSVNKKGLYTDYGLVKIPINNPKSAKLVAIADTKFTGFDGMILNTKGNVVGVTNNGTTAGGNTLIELSSENNWDSAKVINTKAITASTTVATAPKDNYYVINQDFSNNKKETWTIAQIKF